MRYAENLGAGNTDSSFSGTDLSSAVATAARGQGDGSSATAAPSELADQLVTRVAAAPAEPEAAGGRIYNCCDGKAAEPPRRSIAAAPLPPPPPLIQPEAIYARVQVY
jgi:hypothetical protein